MVMEGDLEGNSPVIHLPLATGLWAGPVVRMAATWACSEQQGYKTQTPEADAPPAVHIWPGLGEGRAQLPGKHGYFGVWAGSCLGL